MAHRIQDVEIRPKPQALESINLSDDDFYDALGEALDLLDGRPKEQLPAPANISIVIDGQERRLGELAQIAVSLSANSAPAK